jgi:hypothetical protein
VEPIPLNLGWGRAELDHELLDQLESAEGNQPPQRFIDGGESTDGKGIGELFDFLMNIV